MRRTFATATASLYFSRRPPVEVYADDPAVYHYTYSVDDDYTGAQIYADEARDEGETHGMYEVGE